jgi:hypothetical protein
VPSTLHSRMPSTQANPSKTLDKPRTDITIQVHRLFVSQGNCGEELGKIVPRYRTFQCQKCLGVLRDGSQEGEHDRGIGNQSRTSKRQGKGTRLRAP